MPASLSFSASRSLAPAASRDRGRLWRWSDVAERLGALEPEDREATHFLAAANAVFEFRYGVQLLNDDTVVKELFQLVSEAWGGIWIGGGWLGTSLAGARMAGSMRCSQDPTGLGFSMH